MLTTSRRSRRGFTLVELLVVIAIIGLLAALIMPAIIKVRENARTKKCANNQHQIGVAVENYASKGRYPGYVNLMSHSWVIAVFEGMNQESLYKQWLTGSGPTPRLDFLICPSEDAGGQALLSYVANCGLPGNDEAPAATGVFHDRSGSVKPIPTVMQSDVADGTNYTLMISERLMIALDNTDPDPEEEPSGDDTRRWTQLEEAQIGFTWLSGGSNTMEWHLRSNHPGGVNATFCDNSQKFLSENINYGVYCLLMTPNGPKAGQTGTVSDSDLDP
ncbi:MAG TPA: DUF1559 domain-containing protein [Thermoguttaceae bacterium]|nr:DUF1559 domain-containing protein [Thermoguttaceae bacterium]